MKTQCTKNDDDSFVKTTHLRSASVTIRFSEAKNMRVDSSKMWIRRLSTMTLSLLLDVRVTTAFSIPNGRNTVAATVSSSSSTPSSSSSLLSSPSSQPEQTEAQRLLERARAMRAEIATLEGRSIDEVEAEAQEKREQRRLELATEEEQKRLQQEYTTTRTKRNDNSKNGSFLTIPETFDDQVTQAKAAVERGFRDGRTTQTVRFALLSEGQMLNDEDRQWPGGAQQMYRNAAGPLTRELLRQLKPRRPDARQSDDNHHHEVTPFHAPTVQSQDIWDFDGSALVTAEGVGHNVQAMVLPNTDVKYVKDIGKLRRQQQQKSNEDSDKHNLLLLINPFWRNVESWGFNLLAPNAKKLAQEEIFDNGMFEETYVLLQKSVRGEDCVALKAYPYDWQLFAYADDEYYGAAGSYLVRLGSTESEPTSTDFARLLEQRDEFKLSKNMRQMQRLMNRDNN